MRAYLDVTDASTGHSATAIARAIKDDIRRATGLTGSAGVSYNKFLAKIASDVDKPDGLFVIPPHRGEHFVASLPVRKFHGIGRVTEEKMQALGIMTGADLRRLSRSRLTGIFGKAGEYYYWAARGVDNRLVQPDRVRKSVGSETTFAEDLRDPGELLTQLRRRAAKVAEILVAKELTGHTVTVKIKFADFTQVTRSCTLGSRAERAPRNALPAARTAGADRGRAAPRAPAWGDGIPIAPFRRRRRATTPTCGRGSDHSVHALPGSKAIPPSLTATRHGICGI